MSSQVSATNTFNQSSKVASKFSGVPSLLPHEYEEVTIRELVPGPRWVTFTAKVVNIYDQTVDSKSEQAAKGCLKLLVKDKTAEILVRMFLVLPTAPLMFFEVKLWYATTSYKVTLGTVITIWTTHIHPTASASTALETLSSRPASLLTTIFPERDNGCSIRIHDDESKAFSSKTAPGYVSGHTPAGLVSLATLAISGADGLPDAKVLACVVAIGQPKTRKSKSGIPFTNIQLGIRDTSTTTPFTLVFPQSLIASASTFILNITVLLVTSPRVDPYRPQTITIAARSQIDIDPCIPESLILRKYILRETCPTNQPFPDNFFDMEKIESSPLRLQFTFATLTDFIKANPEQIYTGYLSAIISQLNLTHLTSRKQLFSMECCNMPLYANITTARCGQCGQTVDLLLNPNIIGGISDETGGISTVNTMYSSSPVNNPISPPNYTQPKTKHSPLLIHPQAFADLFGRSRQELAELCRPNLPDQTVQHNWTVLRYLEQRLLWMRVILLVGWTGEWGGGRLAVLRVTG